MTSLPQWLSDFSAAVAPEYRVIRLLGQGGMASVLLAEELALKRLVAIKVLDPMLMSDPAFRTRFSREAEAAASLEHPHIVPIYRVGEVIGIPFFAMQYVEGETLGDRLAREGKLSSSEAVRITREVAQALRVAHKRGIVHRDVKPQNILLNGTTVERSSPILVLRDRRRMTSRRFARERN
jgi:serine/threonine protein kinase